MIGGGFVILSDVQGRQQVGSVGCLVTDGSVTYALTGQHVTGDPGSGIRIRPGRKARRGRHCGCAPGAQEALLRRVPRARRVQRAGQYGRWPGARRRRFHVDFADLWPG